MDTEIYRSNISALTHDSADLVAWIERGSRPEGIDLFHGEAGLEDLVIRSASGSQGQYYGGGGSSVEHERSFITGMDLSAGSMTCLIGAGLGYTAGAILKEMEAGHLLLLIELEPWILKQALSRVNISKGVLNGSFHVLRPWEPGIEDLFVRLISDGALHGNLKIVSDPRSENISGEYALWVKKVQEAYQFGLSLIGSATAVQKVSIENEIENTLLVALSPGVDKLKPLIRRKPVLIVGAGPSLDQSAELILRARDRTYIFAFAAAWRNLLSHGIMPDFVLTSDKNVESMGLLRFTKFAQEIPLIFSSSALPDFVRGYAGPRFVALQSALYPLLPSHANHGISFATGTSVATFALNLAIYLEAEPILFVGLDLAVGAGEKSHASGHPLAVTLDPRDPRTREVEGVRGTTVRTLTHLHDIKRHIEHCISSSGVRPINTTVSGSRIRGTLEMDLDEASAGLPALVKDVPPPSLLSQEDFRIHMPKEGIKRLAGDVRRLKELSERSNRSLLLFRKSCKKGAAEPRLAEPVNSTGKEIKEFLAGHPLLNHYFSGLWLSLKQDTRRSSSILDKNGRLSAEVDKNLRFLKGLTADAERLLRKVERVGKEMSRASRDGKEVLEGAEWARFLLDQGFYGEVFDLVKGMGEEGRVIEAEALAARGLLSEALSRVEGAGAESKARRTVSRLRDRLAKEKEILIREVDDVIGKGSRVDAVLLRSEIERSFAGDPIGAQSRNRLSEKL